MTPEDRALPTRPCGDISRKHTEVLDADPLVPSTPDGRSPAGAEIRYLMEGETGGMIHSTVPPGQVNRATVHATVSEFLARSLGRGADMATGRYW